MQVPLYKDCIKNIVNKYIVIVRVVVILLQRCEELYNLVCRTSLLTCQCLK